MIIEEAQPPEEEDRAADAAASLSQPVSEGLDSPHTVEKDNAAEAKAEDTQVLESPRTRGSEGASVSVDGNTGLMLDIPVQLSVQLGQTEMLFKDALELCPGAVIELDESVDEPVDLLINGKLIETGVVVTVDGRLGVRVLDIARFQSYQDGKQG